MMMMISTRAHAIRIVPSQHSGTAWRILGGKHTRKDVWVPLWLPTWLRRQCCLVRKLQSQLDRLHRRAFNGSTTSFARIAIARRWFSRRIVYWMGGWGWSGGGHCLSSQGGGLPSSSLPSLLGTSLALRGSRRGKNKGFQIGTHSSYCKIPVREAWNYLAALSTPAALLLHPLSPVTVVLLQRSSLESVIDSPQIFA